MKLVKITSEISKYLVSLSIAIYFSGLIIAMLTEPSIVKYFLAFSFGLLMLSIPATFICLIACYKQKVITIGYVILAIILSKLLFAILYLAVVFTLRRDVKDYLKHNATA